MSFIQLNWKVQMIQQSQEWKGRTIYFRTIYFKMATPAMKYPTNLVFLTISNMILIRLHLDYCGSNFGNDYVIIVNYLIKLLNKDK